MGGVKRMEWNRLPPPPPPARSCMHTITHKTQREMKLVVLHESQPPPSPPPCGPHWGTGPHFSSGDTWIICSQVVSCRGNTSGSPHLLPPPALSAKLISWADAFVFVLQRWFDTIIITPAPTRGFPPFTQSNIIRVSQWCWLEITTFFKRCRKCKIHMIWN